MLSQVWVWVILFVVFWCLEHMREVKKLLSKGAGQCVWGGGSLLFLRFPEILPKGLLSGNLPALLLCTFWEENRHTPGFLGSRDRSPASSGSFSVAVTSSMGMRTMQVKGLGKAHGMNSVTTSEN